MSSVTKAVLLGVLVVFVSIVAGLWLSGGRAEIYSTSVSIDAPPDAVFPYLVEPAKLRQWIRGLVETRPIGDPEPKPGARSTEVVEQDGEHIELETEIVEMEKDKRLKVRITTQGMLAESEYTLRPFDGKTRLTQLFIPRFIGFGRLASVFVRSSIQPNLQSDMERLKTAVEKDTR